MFDAAEYQLLDFGEGRRLECFGPLVLDRPCPAADAVRRNMPKLWATAEGRFERGAAEEGKWTLRGAQPTSWTIGHGRIVFELKRTDFGHLGLFPEQAENWDWIERQLAGRASPDGESLKVLNLFAYTGGSTLAAAAAGAMVTHVDAARNVVAWARRNAELSDLAAAPVRWIAEDALAFARRELRRGRRYDAVVLDPPSYGHGAAGETWQLERHLEELLTLCTELTNGQPQFVLLTCHTPGYTAERLRELLARAFAVGSSAPAIDAGEMVLRTAHGRALPCGVMVRWSAERK